MDKIARILVLGNGISRKGLPLKALQERLPIYACNLAFTEKHEDGSPFEPDKLFVYGPPSLKEVHAKGYCKNHAVHVAGIYENGASICEHAIFEHRVGLSTGGQAVHHACNEHGVEEIYLAGFDFFVRENPHHMHNINGSGHNDAACRRWMKQLIGFAQVHQGIRFYRVDGKWQDRFEGIENFRHITRGEMIARIPNGRNK